MAKLALLSKITGTVFLSAKNVEGSSKRSTLEEKFKFGLNEMKFLDSTIALVLKRSSEHKSRLFASNSREDCKTLLQRILETF